MYEQDKIINGNFTNEIVGYEVYVDESAQATYLVDELSEGGAFGIDIFNTGKTEDTILLTQKHILLEKGKTYTISFDAKTSLNRDVQFELKKDAYGKNNNAKNSDEKDSDAKEVSYSGKQTGGLNLGYVTFSHTFTMEEETDENAVFCLSLGAVDREIAKKHTLFIDNIAIEEVK